MKRKTSITKIASILTVLAMVWGGVACTQPETPAPTTYTISFDSGVKSITVEEGAVATKPTDPEKTGYSFGGWLNGEAAYDWTQPVTSNLSLTAKWTAVEYTITYLPEGVETDNPTTYTIETETFELKAPTKAPDATKPNFVAWHNGEKPAEGEWAIVDSIEKGTTGNLTIVAEFSDKEQITITFKGDYTGTKNVDKDSTFAGLTGYDLFYEDGKAFDTTKAIDAAITLTAKAKEFKVTFDSGVEAITVKYNETAKEPAAPTKEGFDFVGWYEGETKFDFATKITKDISLTAKWEEKKAEDPTTPPASGEDDVEEETNYSYVLENLNKEECSIPTTTEKSGGTFGLYYSDTGVAVNEGDKVYFQGTLTFNEALDAQQLYIQTNLNGWKNQAGQVWKDEGIAEGSYNFAVAYDVTAPESLKNVQIAIGCLLEENDDLKVTVKDFYVVHIAKENVEKVFPVVYSTTESPVVLNLKTGEGADGKTYETNINKNSVAFAAGDTIEFSIEIPKGADITGAQQVWMQTAADGWGWHSMLYSKTPYATTADDLLGVVTATCSAAIDIDSINLNYGIQKEKADSSESFSLPITKVTLRKIPKFTSNK